jgi:hypothetical protein
MIKDINTVKKNLAGSGEGSKDLGTGPCFLMTRESRGSRISFLGFLED